MSVIAFDFYDEDDPNGTPLGTLDETDCKSMEFRVALHEMGSGKFTVSRHNTTATSTLIRENNLVKVRIPSVSEDPIFAFWLKEGDFTLIDSREQGGEDLTFGGPGIIYILALSRLPTEPYAPDQPSRGSLDVLHQWTWLNEPYGAILTRVIEEGQNQPGTPLEDVTITFDRVNDSDSVAWPTITETFQTPIGSGLMDVVQRLAAAGDLYLIPEPDLTIHAYQTYGRDLTGAFASDNVRFEKGVNILTQLKRQIQAREVLTHLILQDSDGNYSTEAISGYTSGRAHYGYAEAGQTNDDTQLNKIGQHILDASSTHGQSLELEVTPGFDPANGRYMPGPDGTDGHFWVGDHVTVHTGSGEHDFNGATQTVIAIRVVLDEAADDSTDDTAARSLHIVPELNYLEVRQFTGVSPAELGQPGYCCGPTTAIPIGPGTPDTVVAQWHFAADNEDDDDQGYLFENAVGGSPWSSLEGGTARAGLQGTLGTNLIPATVGTAYAVTALLKNRWSLNPTDGVVLRLSFLDSIGDTLATHYSNATVGVDNWTVVSVGGTAPTGTTHMRLRTLRGPSGPGNSAHHSLDDVIITAVGTGSGGTPGHLHPDLIPNANPNVHVPYDHRHAILSDAAPTPNDDAVAGLPVTTFWYQLDDPDDPTEIIRAWVLVDNSSGAALWLPWPTGDGDDDEIGDLPDDLIHGRYLYFAHKNDDSRTYLLTSYDGITFTEASTQLFEPASGDARDPSYVHWNGKHYLVHTTYNAASVTFRLWESDDLLDWTNVANPSVAGARSGASAAWAPHFFVDPADASLHVFVAVGAGGEFPTNFKIYETHPTNTALTTWSTPVEVTGTGFTSTYIDPYMVYAPEIGTAGKPYKLFWKSDVAGDANRWIAYSESGSLTSGFAAVETGDWAGWKDTESIEAPCIIRLDSGRWRAYFNENDGLGSVAVYYSDSTDDWATWSARASITTPDLMAHGDIIHLHSPLDHNRDPMAHGGSSFVQNAGRWEPVVHDPGSGPELVFHDGDIVMHWVTD